MKVLSEKRKELTRVIALLIVSIRTEKGCKRCDSCQSMDDENGLLIGVERVAFTRAITRLNESEKA
jgi:quinol monooxygenase YgiN